MTVFYQLEYMQPTRLKRIMQSIGREMSEARDYKDYQVL